MEKWAPTVVRLVLGLIFIRHGWGKIQGLITLMNGGEWQFVDHVASIGFLVLLPPLVWAVLATLAEFVGGLLVLVGFRCRLAALSLVVVMFVAIVGVHFPAGDNIEFPLALMAMAMSLVLSGPGRYSIKLKK